MPVVLLPKGLKVQQAPLKTMSKQLKDYVRGIPANHILVFPSDFLYPHKVCEVTSGERFSFVSWAW
jgi:predicted 2-oxoglutarate/Fe(II)-dependent dioxygenase YbiX